MKSKSQQAAQEFLEGPATEVLDEWDEMMALWEAKDTVLLSLHYTDDEVIPWGAADPHFWAEEEENEA